MKIRPASWQSSKPEVAAINEKGVLTVKSAGVTKITVTFGSGKGAAKQTLTVKVKF